MDSDLHETNSAHVADAILVARASVVQMLNHGPSIMFQDWKPCISVQLQRNYLHSFHWKLFDFPWQRAMSRMQHTEMEFSALLPTHTVSAFFHVRKRRPTLVYFWMRQMLCKRSVRTKKVVILTVDIDVVIFAVASFSTTVPDQFWVAFGVGSNCRHIAVHEVCFTLNPTQCLTLPEHHAFIACDTVPSVAGRGQKTAWEMWKSFSEVNDVFLKHFSVFQYSKRMRKSRIVGVTETSCHYDLGNNNRIRLREETASRRKAYEKSSSVSWWAEGQLMPYLQRGV